MGKGSLVKKLGKPCTKSWTLYGQQLNLELLKENSIDYRTGGTNCYFVEDNLILIRICILVVGLLLIQKVLVFWFNGMKIYGLYCLCNVYVSFFISCFCVFLGAATVLIFFLNAFVLYLHLEHVQRMSFCRCFLIFNPAFFCVDKGVILCLKIKNPSTTTKNLSGSTCYTPEVYRNRSRSRSQANFSGAGLDSELSLTSKLE